MLLNPVEDLAPGARCAVTGLADDTVRFSVAAASALWSISSISAL